MACVKRTPADIQADIDELQAALKLVLTGKQVKSLTIGSDDLQRRYSYNEINVGMLKEELRRLHAELADATSCSGIRFDTSRRSHLVVTPGV